MSLSPLSQLIHDRLNLVPRLRLLLLWHHCLLWSPGRSAEQCGQAMAIGKGRICRESRVRVGALQRCLLLLLLLLV